VIIRTWGLFLSLHNSRDVLMITVGRPFGAAAVDEQSARTPWN
jgi:hypothetical protein